MTTITLITVITAINMIAVIAVISLITMAGTKRNVSNSLTNNTIKHQ